MSAEETPSASSPARGPSIEPIVEQAAAIALQDAVAYLRSMQTLSVATSAVLRRRLLDTGEPVEATLKQVQEAERALMDTVYDAFSLYRRALELANATSRGQGAAPKDGE